MATAYARLYNILKDKILSAEVLPGEQLPTEREICESYGVSRITSRHALRLLQEQGLVERFPGRGTFVRAARPQKIPILNVDCPGSIRREAPAIFRELALSRTVEPPKHIVRELGLLKSEECTIAMRVDLRDDERMALDRAFIPSVLSGSLTEDMLKQVDFLRMWIEAEGIVVSHISESIEAVSADGEARTRLGVVEGAPMLLTRHVVFAEGNVAVGVFETLYRGDRFKLISTIDQKTPAKQLHNKD